MSKETLVELAYEKIKGLIKDGTYLSGMPLPEMELAERLQMSRTPIRGALQKLQEDMLVVVKPRFGAYVATLDLAELKNMYAIREVLEGLMARLNCNPVNSSKPYEELLSRYDEISKLERLEEREEQYNIVNAEYDKLLLEKCHNSDLAKMVGTIQGRVRSFHFVAHLIPIFPDQGASERVDVIKAIIKKDGEAAEAASRYRIRCSLKRILNAVPS